MKKLRGLLWKPGVNGLGVRGFHHLPYKKRFDQAARRHDRLYDMKGGASDREFADIEFFYLCLKSCSTTFQAIIASIYFVFVRCLGWLFYRYDRET